jgi:hypothetical protein
MITFDDAGKLIIYIYIYIYIYYSSRKNYVDEFDN